MMILGSFGKIGAIFVSIPDPVVGGVSIVLFGKTKVNGTLYIRDEVFRRHAGLEGHPS